MRLIGLAQIAVGVINHCLVAPSQVFKPAILANAAAIIVAHNHPSGDPTHSQADREMTRQLIDAGKTLGIPVHDHLIIAPYRYVSLVESGIL